MNLALYIVVSASLNDIFNRYEFHEDWAKIVDFSQIANYLAFPILHYPYFISMEKFITKI